MDAAERRVVGVASLLHGIVHANVLAIPVFLERAWRVEFTRDDATLGLVAATAYVAFGAGGIPFGYLADRRGSPRLLLACVGGILGGLVALSVSTSLVAVAGALAVLGLFSGIYHPTGLALISRAVRAPGWAMGWHGVGGSLGIALGPAAVGALLALGMPWRSVAAALLAPASVALVILVASRVRDAPSARGTASLVTSVRSLLRGAFPLVLLVYLFAGIAYWGSLTFLPRFVGTESYVVLLAVGAVGQLAAGHLADRPRSERILLALSLLAGGLLLLIASPAAAAFAPVPWAFGLLLFSLEPLQNILVTSTVPADRRGLAFGMTFLSVFGVGSVGAALAGFLLREGQVTVLFGVLAGCLGVSGVLARWAGVRARAAT
ncbi:MAG: MFS transporter [Methanobacteriota archaeon]